MGFNQKAYFEALDFAKLVHIDQKRSNGDPYIFHPIRVSQRVLGVTLSQDLVFFREKLAIAALLHDVIEDDPAANPPHMIDTLNKTFGSFISSIVQELTQDQSLSVPDRRKKMVDECNTLTLHARVVKLADRLDNISEMGNNMSDKFKARYLEETPIMLGKMKDSCPELEQAIWRELNRYKEPEFDDEDEYKEQAFRQGQRVLEAASKKSSAEKGTS